MEISDHLDRALRNSFEELTKEELVDLAVLLVFEGLHHAGAKPKSKSTFKTYAKRELEELKNGRKGDYDTTTYFVDGLPVKQSQNPEV